MSGDLRRREAEIERRQRRARLACAEQEWQEMIGVLGEIGDPLLRPHARSDQRIGDAGGHRVDLREGRRAALEREGGGVHVVAPARAPHPPRMRRLRDRSNAVPPDGRAPPPAAGCAGAQERAIRLLLSAIMRGLSRHAIVAAFFGRLLTILAPAEALIRSPSIELRSHLYASRQCNLSQKQPVAPKCAAKSLKSLGLQRNRALVVSRASSAARDSRVRRPDAPDQRGGGAAPP